MPRGCCCWILGWPSGSGIPPAAPMPTPAAVTAASQTSSGVRGGMHHCMPTWGAPCRRGMTWSLWCTPSPSLSPGSCRGRATRARMWKSGIRLRCRRAPSQLPASVPPCPPPPSLSSWRSLPSRCSTSRSTRSRTTRHIGPCSMALSSATQTSPSSSPAPSLRPQRRPMMARCLSSSRSGSGWASTAASTSSCSMRCGPVAPRPCSRGWHRRGVSPLPPLRSGATIAPASQQQWGSLTACSPSSSPRTQATGHGRSSTSARSS
mmetsp:Transcript_11245/g.33758  ORF Transcript_11245/g.33758 Transcript_11245/m.33758 type:complete len:263 (+) Transcript_11245:1133-1921(+)